MKQQQQDYTTLVYVTKKLEQSGQRELALSVDAVASNLAKPEFSKEAYNDGLVMAGLPPLTTSKRKS